eukprot:5921656-Pleurochrysis_carterae.AAC.1
MLRGKRDEVRQKRASEDAKRASVRGLCGEVRAPPQSACTISGTSRTPTRRCTTSSRTRYPGQRRQMCAHTRPRLSKTRAHALTHTRSRTRACTRSYATR